MQRRIFFSDDNALTDMSVNLTNYHSGTNDITMVAAEDAIYIGSSLPFNHFYVKLSAVNTQASTLTLQYWGNSGAWTNAVDVIDETDLGGATLGQSGFISFVPDKDTGWFKDDTNYGGNEITGLTDVEIYDLFWIKLSVSADLDEVSLDWVGQKFSTDDDLGSEFPDLLRSSVLSAYETGKTNWEEQHIRAADIIAKDLIAGHRIIDRNQILDRFDLQNISVQKVAELIYSSFGDNDVDNRIAARKEYEIRLGKCYPRIDRNKTGRDDDKQRSDITVWGRSVR